MLEKIKSNLTYAVCAVIGLFNYILFAIPYIAAYVSIDLGERVGKRSQSVGVSGYEVMDLWDLGFSGVMSSIIQILVLIVGVALLVWGVLGLLKAFGVFDKFPDQLGGIKSKTVGEYGLFGIAGLNLLLLVFLIILTATNSESYSESGMESSMGIRLSAGIFISLVITAGAAAAIKLLEGKLPVSDGAQVVYTCTGCGKPATAKENFCSECGGAIEAKIIVKEEYACTSCGKPATAKENFCSECGGEIKVKETASAETEEAPIETGKLPENDAAPQ